MSYRTIRVVGVISIVMSGIFLTVGLWQMLSGASAEESGPALDRILWFAFFLMGILATRVGSALESQSAEIANLRRRLDEHVLPVPK